MEIYVYAYEHVYIHKSGNDKMHDILITKDAFPLKNSFSDIIIFEKHLHEGFIDILYFATGWNWVLKNF